MNTSITIQVPGCKKDATLDQTIAMLSSSQKWEQLSVAVAYSSLAGVARLHEVVSAAQPKASFRWLLGLDDYVTQPGAIDFCCSVGNTDVRVYSSTKAKTRFHPKVFLFDSSLSEVGSSMIIGSANLTFAAFNRNCEAVAILDAQDSTDKKLMRSNFQCLWDLGQAPTPPLLADYRAKFEENRKSRAFLLGAEPEQGTNTGPILHSDAALVNPSTATVCWIEVGKNTALGRELEVKGEQARFFGLEPCGGPPAFRDFIVSNGEIVNLRLKYQQKNSMWRLQLRSDVPEVADGLRPDIGGRLGRSPYVAVFKRTETKDRFILEFPRHDSNEFDSIRKQSEHVGTIGSTSSRQYGWF
jgi:HKD family nuclease